MRQNDRGCSFCSRTDTALRSKSPQQVYDEFQSLVSLGADRIEEFSDSWLYDRKWLREFALPFSMIGAMASAVIFSRILS